MPLTREEVDLELAKLHESGRNERQKNFFNLVTNSLNLILGAVNAVMILNNGVVERVNHAETVRNIEVQAGELKEQNTVAVKTAAKAVDAAAKVEEKVDATNLQWKAYRTKNPEDELLAEEVLAKAVKGME
jgi:hypothetical protein